MSGHSKYSTIKHHKAIQDGKRAKSFLSILKRITLAASSNPNPETNNTLKNLITIAKKNNVPKQTILKAIERSKQSTEQLIERLYEGLFCGKVWIIIKCLTTNINRSNANIKACFRKHNTILSGSNSCLYLFEQLLLIRTPKINDSQLLKKIRDESLLIYEEEFVNEAYFYYFSEEIKEINDFFATLKIIPMESQLAYRPINQLENMDNETLIKFKQLIQTLEKDEDIDSWWSNISNKDVEFIKS